MDSQEILAAIRNWFSKTAKATGFWLKRYRPWVFSGLTILTILLVVWARFGFTFEVGQFFAAEPSQEGMLTVQCGASSNTLTWTRDSTADSNSIERGNTGAKNAGVSGCADYWCWLPSQGFNHQVPTANAPATYTDTQIDEGVCYQYRIKYQAQLPSNSVFCPTNCDAQETATPTPTTSVPPTPEELACAPAAQTVEFGQISRFEASGGPGDYSWSINDRDVEVSGSEFEVNFTESGEYEVVVQDDEGQTATCTSNVIQSEPPGPGDFAIAARVRNFTQNGEYRASATGQPSQQFQVRITVDAGEPGIENVVVSAPLPNTVTYVAGSTTIDGSPTSVDTVTTGGLPIGDLNGRDEITFLVQAKPSGQLPSGTITSMIDAMATGDDTSTLSARVTLIITNAPAIQPPAQVPTGPGDVGLLALMSAALLTLLYVSYTHTGLYRIREVDSITQDGDHMDFKS